MKTAALVALFLFPSLAFAQQPVQQQVTPSQIAISVDDNVNALAKFAEQQIKAIETLNSQNAALTKERDDLKKKLDEAMKQHASSAPAVPPPAKP